MLYDTKDIWIDDGDNDDYTSELLPVIHTKGKER